MKDDKRISVITTAGQEVGDYLREPCGCVARLISGDIVTSKAFVWVKVKRCDDHGTRAVNESEASFTDQDEEDPS